MLRYCTLASSSSGNSAFLTDGVTKILIDLGISTRAVERELNTIGVDADGHVVVSMTDLGCVSDGIYPYLDGVELLLIEANYDPDRLRCGKYPEPLKRRIASDHGHLSNPDCAECALHAAKCGVKTILLGHLSRENNTPRLAYETVHSKLTQNGLIPGVDVMLSVAPREGHSEWYTLE